MPRKKILKPPLTEPPPEPTQAELKRLTEFHARKKGQDPAPRLQIEATGPKSMALSEPPSVNPLVWQIDLLRALGTTNSAFANQVLSQLLNACNGSETVPTEIRANGLLAAVHQIGPRDELEGMLAAQMVATHDAAMDLLRQMRSSRPLSEAAGNLAIKFLRTYTAQLEALKRHRSGGEQRVVVQHQHVNVTAENAAVQVNSSITATRVGGGGAEKAEERPYGPATITSEPGIPLWCEDPARDAVPVPGPER